MNVCVKCPEIWIDITSVNNTYPDGFSNAIFKWLNILLAGRNIVMVYSWECTSFSPETWSCFQKCGNDTEVNSVPKLIIQTVKILRLPHAVAVRLFNTEGTDNVEISSYHAKETMRIYIDSFSDISTSASSIVHLPMYITLEQPATSCSTSKLLHILICSHAAIPRNLPCLYSHVSGAKAPKTFKNSPNRFAYCFGSHLVPSTLILFEWIKWTLSTRKIIPSLRKCTSERSSGGTVIRQAATPAWRASSQISLYIWVLNNLAGHACFRLNMISVLRTHQTTRIKNATKWNSLYLVIIVQHNVVVSSAHLGTQPQVGPAVMIFQIHSHIKWSIF